MMARRQAGELRLPDKPARQHFQPAKLNVAGVGVGVEVDHRHQALADVLGHACGVRPGDSVVAAEDDR